MDHFIYTDVHLLPEEQIDLHEQEYWELSYVIIGAGTRIIGNVREPFKSGEVLLIPPRIPHCWYFGKEETDKRGRISNITVMFSNQLLDELPALFPSLQEKIDAMKQRKDAVQFEKEKANEIISLLLQMRQQTEAERIPTFISLLMETAADGDERILGKYQKPDPAQERLDKVKVYVVCNFNRDISLDDMASHVAMNRSAFCTFFKRATGTTFFEYLNQYRIDQACRLLRLQTYNIAEVCYQCGFNNVPYFNRLFRRIVGMSPGEYVVSVSRRALPDIG